MIKILRLTCIAIVLLWPFTSSGYIQYYTHPLINQVAIDKSSTDLYLKRTLGLPEGINEAIDGKEIYKWVSQGGTDEDNFPRGLYHFHDPTKPWDQAGILVIGFSSVLWAQDHTTGLAPDCQNFNVTCSETANPEWSWPAARNYFYQALTSSGSSSVRDEKLAKTFYTLGRVMHLLADAAVPEHSRNDQHMIFPLGSRYEERVENRVTHQPAEGYIAYIKSQNTITPIDYAAITSTTHMDDYIPIFNFWDTTPGEGPGIANPGLSEYTNYNFISPGTLFAPYQNPVRPPASAKYLESVTGDDGASELRIYFRGSTSDNMTINHFVSAAYLWKDLEGVSPIGRPGWDFVLDEKCFDDHAAILVPKAISYDAGLLNYFFRGALEITPPDENVYAITDGRQHLYADAYGHQHQEFTKIKAKVRNTTLNNEQIGAGTLQAEPIGSRLVT